MEVGQVVNSKMFKPLNSITCIYMVKNYPIAFKRAFQIVCSPTATRDLAKKPDTLLHLNCRLFFNQRRFFVMALFATPEADK